MIYRILLLLAITVFLTNCNFNVKTVKGKGNVIEKTFDFQEFNEVSINIDAKIQYIQSDEYKVIAKSNSNIIEILKFKLNGNTINLDFKKGYGICCDTKIEVFVYAPDIEKIEINSSADLICENNIKSKQLELIINGNGDIDIKSALINNVYAEINGNGDIYIKGIGTNVEIEIDGVGDADFSNYRVKKAYVEINGTGDCKVLADKSLDIKIDGVGNVFWRGKASVSSKIKGKGSILDEN